MIRKVTAKGPSITLQLHGDEARVLMLMLLVGSVLLPVVVVVDDDNNNDSRLPPRSVHDPAHPLSSPTPPIDLDLMAVVVVVNIDTQKREMVGE